ncbi:hypothetical protein [Rhizobium leguminosarum]|uniref:hypothetical protein n=1 Tax=Rhizobium leguminosarum TaxID=384 RepID=UPI00102F83D0|nr:hypothetical protein [Rhizobium leguminosarum]TAY14001.1 hypothetical protein ELH96_20595 [Rhizobium leguminosarum]
MLDGEAANDAQRQRELGDLAIRNAAAMAFPPTDWEQKVLGEVLKLPRVAVVRPPEEELLAADMVRNDCHLNCHTQEANDPERLSRHVTGWLIDGSDLILHSVVDYGGQWLCLTPQLAPAPSKFQFIPDPSIEWRGTSDGTAKEAFRSGNPLPTALRKYPEAHIRMRDEFSRLMASGMSAFDARKRVDATLGVEFRKKDPI